MAGAPGLTRTLLDRRLLGTALLDTGRKLDPRLQLKNPVMFVVFVGSVLTSAIAIDLLLHPGTGSQGFGFVIAISAWLWLTVLFANFAEAIAEGRGKAQAAALRSTRGEVTAKKLAEPRHGAPAQGVPASSLRRGDIVQVEARETIPADGEVIAGAASVDESAITGESAPVLRESGSDFSSVTGGTRVLSDWLVIRVTANPGEAFLDRMIAMVEGTSRQRTPNEIALALSLIHI